MPKLTGPHIIEYEDTYATNSQGSFDDLGAIGVTSDGRTFRRVYSGGSALVKGNLIQGPARDTAFTDMAVQAIVAIGATVIPITLGGTSTTANMFNGGTLHITSSTGIGQTFTILSHDVATNATTCNFTVLEPVLTALATSSKATAALNPYNGVIQSPTTITGPIVGVAVTAIPLNNWGWVQSGGPCSVLSDSTVATIGQGVQRSTATAGAVTQATTNGYAFGQAMVLGVSAEEQPVLLSIN